MARNLFTKWVEEHESQLDEYKLTLHLITRNPLTLFGVIILTIFSLMALFPQIFPFYSSSEVFAVKTETSLLPPSWQHLFGTDDLGRDVYSRVVLGCRYSLYMGFSAIAIAMCIGIPLGLVAGYREGITGGIIMRITDVFLSVPTILLALTITVILGRGFESAIFAIGFTWWPSYCRLVRGQVLSIKEQDYVAAAKAIGASERRIIFSHILPNSLSVILIQSSMQLGYAILLAGTLGFLGLGAQPPTPEWGSMLGRGRRFIPTFWWMTTFPGLAMFAIVLAFCFLGDGIRDITDPRYRR